MVRTEDEANDQAYRSSHHATHLDCILLAMLGWEKKRFLTFVKGGRAMLPAWHRSYGNRHDDECVDVREEAGKSSSRRRAVGGGPTTHGHKQASIDRAQSECEIELSDCRNIHPSHLHFGLIAPRRRWLSASVYITFRAADSAQRSEQRVEKDEASPHPPFPEPNSASQPCISRAAHHQRPSLRPPSARPPSLQQRPSLDGERALTTSTGFPTKSTRHTTRRPRPRPKPRAACLPARLSHSPCVREDAAASPSPLSTPGRRSRCGPPLEQANNSHGGCMREK
ncbi:hypothetical protein PSPO01_05378 [Paraphaeosphaeria sporulosa]